MAKTASVRRSKRALLICDMLNDFDFPEGPQLLPRALKAARAIARLKEKARALKIPVIYVNDNFDHWLADWKEIWSMCAGEACPGRAIAKLLKPESDDYFILKPKHSGFRATSLEVLLQKIGAKELIITGIAGNICVLFTAHDAHMLEYSVTVPRDAIASNTVTDNNYAVRQLKDVLKMKTPTTATLIRGLKG